MCLHEHIRNDHLIGKLRMFSLVSWVGMIADVKPGPAIKAARTYAADIIGWQIVAELVPFVGAHPQCIATRPKGDPDSVANAPRIHFSVGAVGVELEDACAIGFRGIIGIVRARTDGDIHFLAVRRKNNVVRPMSSTAQVRCATRKLHTKLFSWPTGFEITVAIRKSDYTTGVRHVQKLRIVTRRIKGDPERLVQISFCEYFGDKDVPIRCGK